MVKFNSQAIVTKIKNLLSPPENICVNTSYALEREFEELHGAPKPPLPEVDDDHVRLKALFDRIHKLPKGQTALCLSGGGIRSATFNLGILQGLAKIGILDKFDYLSTVSGGGYIGAWLSAWILHKNNNIKEVIKGLTTYSSSTLDSEDKPIRFLRSYSNYLNPKIGILNADTWTLIATFLRNLLLNWLVIWPLFIAVLMIPRFYIILIQMHASSSVQYMTIAGAGLCIYIALRYVVYDLPSLGNRKKSQSSFLLHFFMPLAASVFLFSLFWVWFNHNPTGEYKLLYFVIIGAIIHLAGWVGFIKVGYRLKGKRIPRLGASTLCIAAASTGAIGGWLAYLAANNVFSEPLKHIRFYACFAAPAVTTIFLIVGLLFVGSVSKITDDEDREWWARSTAWLLLFIAGWFTVSALVIYGPSLLLQYDKYLLKEALLLVGGMSGIVTAALGFSSKTPASSTDDSKTNSLPTKIILKIAPAVFVLALPALLSLVTTWFLRQIGNYCFSADPHRDIILKPDAFNLLILFMGMLALGTLSGVFINANKFSLHAMYRNRLVRAFLGASREKRDPNRFTGFDPADNIKMHELPNRPLHVVNVALNIVKDPGLAWQQRKAESFTFTKFHAGSLRLKYRPSEVYGGKKDPITLGTAMAISGAALSPNMGYHSSPLVTFIMAIFNIRLGWWLGNPGEIGKDTWFHKGPGFSIKPLIDETFGLTTNASEYVYLSDGGHFDNLGLYEMVYRRCRVIVLSDASCDPDHSFEDLGNAIRKIRIDFGIEINIDIESVKSKDAKYCCVVGTIDYKRADGHAVKNGCLIYIKPTVCGNAPVDVYNYHATNKNFPHQSTSDQWFNESQFESYRILGKHTVELLGKDIFDGMYCTP